MDHREHAQSLRRRLNDHAVDIELLTAEASDLFRDAGLIAQERWTKLELNGYGEGADARRLREILGVAANDRLIAHVAAYRVQGGIIVDENGARTGELQHFFVEKVNDLIAARNRIHHGNVSGALVLEFGPPHQGIPDYPRSAEFTPGVFERILLGLRAVLHLQLGIIAQ